MSTSGSTEPRVVPSRPRLPRAYTDEQLAFLRGNLGEFERRSQSSVRGDAKKFALEMAAEFVSRYGLPSDVETGPDVDSEAKFKEQIYNWFKNTVGRTRRKLEGRSRVNKRSVDGDSGASGPNTINWTTNLASPTIIPYSESHCHATASPSLSSNPSAPHIPYSGPQGSTSMRASPPLPNLSLNLNVTTLRDALLTPAIDASTLSSMFQTYAISHPSLTPLTTIVLALFDAITAADSSASASPSAPPPSQRTSALLRRFLDACSYFPPTVVHASVPGPQAGARALQMQLRKCSLWLPNSPALAPASATSSISDEMQRIAADRVRRKNYIQWARIHAAALELGILDSMRTFSEMMARDLVWEDEEVEWVAGICVLRALIRTGGRGDARTRDEFRELFTAYEGRWKEIRDEGRQELVTEYLLDAKQALLALDDHFMS